MLVTRRNQDFMPTLFNELMNWNDTTYSTPRMNIMETKDNYKLELCIPGLTKEDVKLSIDAEGNLVVEMVKETKKENKEEMRYLRHEFSVEHFRQTVMLPEDIHKEQISAKVENGRKGVLHCQAGEEFEFTLGSEEEKYLLRSGKFKEEMKKQEFPALEKEYEGEKGVKLHIKEKKKTRYTGVIEFKEKELEFEGDERAGALEGNMQYENDPQPFRLYPEDGKLIFQTGKFKDELMTEYERKIAPHLKAAREARAKKAWKELTDELEEIAKVDEKNSELQKLKAEVAHQKEEELKEAKEAKEQEEWKVVKKKVEVVLALEKDNEEAKRLKEQAEEELKKPHTGDNTTIQLGNGVELEMIWIEPGTFIMGSPANELGRLSNELQHQVTLTKGYWLGKYEVTQAQYEAIMGKNPSSKIMGLGIGTNYPVNCVSWKDATNFCAKLTEMEREAGQLPKGYVYTLPTEAQWEYACRAGTTTALNSGANLTSENDCPYMDEVGWSWYNSGNRTHPTWYNPGRTTHFVGQKRPNAWGLYDMHGNMSELCLDWFDKNYYEESPATDPQGPDKGSYRVIRGGYWGSHAGGCRSAYRSYSAPGSRGSYCGFRVALAPVQ